MKKQLFFSMLAAAALPAAAHTDLLNTDFSDNNWRTLFTTLELDHNAPATAINAAFLYEGVSQPWWTVKDSANGDRFLASHSYYQSQNKTSNDWLVSGPLNIESTGFKLSFGAQSLPIRSGEEHALSDLWVFVTEKPVTADWQPAASEAALHIEKLSYGKYIDVCEGDFIPYELDLDAYAGKTVYISFANLNTDKDLLCIDDVLLRRLDSAELSATAPVRVEHGDFDVNVAVKGSVAEGLKDWTLTFKCGEITETKTGAMLAMDQVENYTFTGKVGSDATADWTVSLTAEGATPLNASGSTTGLSFMPHRRVLVEEATGVWCGNCPTALYLFEQMEEDPEISDKFLPVAVHTQGDPMTVSSYEAMLGFNGVAPAARIDRSLTPLLFGNNDMTYDLSNPLSAANKIKLAAEEVTIADINVTGEYLTNAGKITGIDVTAEVTPAVTIDGNDYKIGFILTENNVHLDDLRNTSWHQHNYLAKSPEIGDSHPWKSLPKTVANVHFQDVARECYSFRGFDNSVPARTIKADEKFTYNTQLALPDPYLENEAGVVTSPALNTENLYITVFLLDAKNYTVINANRVALGENPEPRFTSWDLCKSLGVGVDGIESDEANLPAEYYNLQGVKVVNPTEGIYIVRRGSKVTKEIIR